jgi:hypothetical protein
VKALIALLSDYNRILAANPDVPGGELDEADSDKVMLAVKASELLYQTVFGGVVSADLLPRPVPDSVANRGPSVRGPSPSCPRSARLSLAMGLRARSSLPSPSRLWTPGATYKSS